MRTTLNLDDELFLAVKQRAAAKRSTVTALVEAALRELLQQEDRPRGSYTFDANPVRGTVREGVDINDRDALYEIMDGRT